MEMIVIILGRFACNSYAFLFRFVQSFDVVMCVNMKCKYACSTYVGRDFSSSIVALLRLCACNIV